MMLHVVLCRFRCVVRGMVKVTLSGMRVVRGRLVVALFVMSCRCAMMARRVFVMFRCLMMMLCRLLRHSSSSFYRLAGQPDCPARGSVLLGRLTNRQWIVNAGIRLRKKGGSREGGHTVNVHGRPNLELSR